LVIFSVCLENIPFFTELVYSTTRVFSFRFTAEEIPEIESSASQLMDYTERLASVRRAAPRDDFLSTYLVAADQAGEMSPLEILIQFLFVIVAGSDMTRGALAVQTAQLLQHREQWEAVCVIIRAVVIPTSGSGRGRGPLSEGSAKELRVVQETAIEATYFPPHS
jgi:cytochrome P450